MARKKKPKSRTIKHRPAGPTRIGKGGRIGFRRWNRVPRSDDQAVVESPQSFWVKSGGVAQITDGDAAWISLTFAEGESDDAQAGVLLANTQVSHTLSCGFDFSVIPDGATVDGIEVVLRGRDPGVPQLATFQDIQWRSGGTKVGNDLATAQQVLSAFSNFTVGGPTNKWGLALTPAMIKAADWTLGVAFLGHQTNVPGIDSIKATVYFTN